MGERADLSVRTFQWEVDAAATEAARAIRQQVFIDEQDVPEELEWDEFDAGCVHALAQVGSKGVATGRLQDEGGGEGRIGRMAVLSVYRGMGLGANIMDALIAAARERGMDRLVLSSQTYAVPFYARYGFVAEGEEYMDAGIPHLTMRASLMEE